MEEDNKNREILQDNVKTFFGLDFSTQQVKAIVTDQNMIVLQEASVQFDSDLPEYRTRGGVNAQEDSMVVTAPVMMWIKALDMLMDKLRVAGTDFSTICGISGSGQQHGSVYWRKGASSSLKNLQSKFFLHEQLSHSFAISDCPVWMDSSTSVYCRKLEEKVGGPEKLAQITGSRAYERMTGNQIAKIYETKYEAYQNTEHCAPNLKEKLGDPVPSNSKVGLISKYFVERYDFNPDCCVVAFTGDNPASLAGIGLGRGEVAVSLGTSDTLFLWLDKPKPSLEGHIYVNPVDQNAYMALLCFKNGSLAREKIRDKCSEGSWDLFNQLLDMTPAGNFGNIGMYYFNKEITPELDGVFCFNKAGELIDRYTSKEVEVRALIEGQLIAKRLYAQRLGLDIKDVQRVLATGGASANISILQVLADVFNSPVYTMKVTNSTCIGAASLAKSTVYTKEFHEVIKRPEFTLACSPNQEAAQMYATMIIRFENLENMLLKKQTGHS